MFSAAINKERIRNNNEGIYLCHGLFTLKWKYWADSIKKAMDEDDIKIISGYQIPKINMVAKEILVDPTIFLERLDNSNNLNSLSILSLLKVQMTNTDTPTTNWEIIEIFSIKVKFNQTYKKVFKIAKILKLNKC